MVKLKTRKFFAKRLRVTGRKKLMRRRPNQSHFRAKKSGNQIRHTHSDASFARESEKQIKKFIPYI